MEILTFTAILAFLGWLHNLGEQDHKKKYEEYQSCIRQLQRDLQNLEEKERKWMQS